MKFSTALTVGLAPVVLARQVRNVYPPIRRDGHLTGGHEVVKEQPEMQKGHEVVKEQPEMPKGHEVVKEQPEMPKGHEVVKEQPEMPKGHEKAGNEMLLKDGFGAGHKAEVIIIWANPGGEHETTKYHEQVTVTETVTAPGEHATPPPVHPPEAAATHTVVVGGPAGLVYEPETLENVPIGDMVIFEFLAENHTVTQSTFDLPCDPLEGGMDSGHQPNPDNSIVPAPQVAMQVTTDEPLWFYCKTGPHCGMGMVFSINPTADKSQAAFKEKAIADNGDGAASPITGGEPPANEDEEVQEPPAGGEPTEGGGETVEQPEGGNGNQTQPPPSSGGSEGTKPGQGVIGEDGSCLCMVSCDMSGGFPAAEVQGVGSYGGWGGSLDASMGSRRR